MADTLYVNESHLGGNATAAQAKQVVSALKEKGYTVEYTDRTDLPNPADSIQTSDWEGIVRMSNTQDQGQRSGQQSGQQSRQQSGEQTSEQSSSQGRSKNN